MKWSDTSDDNYIGKSIWCPSLHFILLSMDLVQRRMVCVYLKNIILLIIQPNFI